jgi:hypothetical protein
VVARAAAFCVLAGRHEIQRRHLIPAGGHLDEDRTDIYAQGFSDTVRSICV